MIDYILTLITAYPACAFIVALCLGGVTDWLWASWAIFTKKNKAFAAANLSVLMYLFGIIYTLIIIDKNLMLIIAYITGGWIGTYFAVKEKKKNND